MKHTSIILILIIIVGACSIERVEKPSSNDPEFYHGIMRKHSKMPGCDLFFELDDGTIIVPYKLDYPLMMPDGQEVEISYTVMEDIESGCAGGVMARINELRQVGCGPIINLGIDYAYYGERLDIVPDDFEIDQVEMVYDCLKLAVSYSGGCEIHEFLLYVEPLPAFDEIHAALSLAHYGHGDVCSKIIRDTVSFDLTPLQRNSANYSRLSLSKSNNRAENSMIYIDYYYK